MTAELVQRYREALDAGDFDTAHALLDPDVEIIRPSGRRYRGADTLRSLWERSGGSRNIASAIDGREYAEQNGRVRETCHISHHWIESGDLAYTSREETVITVRDGRIARMESTVEHREPE